MKKAPPTPLTTSTLQIDGNTKLGFSSKQTMRLAQELYETGRITYMRTDSMNLAEKFLDEAQAYIRTTFGEKYAEGARRFKTNKKARRRRTKRSAQQRSRRLRIRCAPPWSHAPGNSTISSGAAPSPPSSQARNSTAPRWTLRSPLPEGGARGWEGGCCIPCIRLLGRVPGLHESLPVGERKILPELAKGDTVDTKSIIPNQHFTEPPARYSDATLVKALEEFGIGRPSTYAPTISTIIDRGYVERDENKKLAPTDIALIVNDVLVNHFPQIVGYEFTATMENTLDEIAEGKVEWVPTLEAFYGPFHQNLEAKTKELDRADIMPDRVLGTDPESGLPITLKTGRFGGFVQVGEYTKEDKKPANQNLRAPHSSKA